MKKEKTLELTLKIRADEAVLREIQDKLMNTSALRLPLTDLLVGKMFSPEMPALFADLDPWLEKMASAPRADDEPMMAIG